MIWAVGWRRLQWLRARSKWLRYESGGFREGGRPSGFNAADVYYLLAVCDERGIEIERLQPESPGHDHTSRERTYPLVTYTEDAYRGFLADRERGRAESVAEAAVRRLALAHGWDVTHSANNALSDLRRQEVNIRIQWTTEGYIDAWAPGPSGQGPGGLYEALTSPGYSERTTDG